MESTKRRKSNLIAICVMCLALYAYGVISASFIPSHIESII